MYIALPFPRGYAIVFFTCCSRRGDHVSSVKLLPQYCDGTLSSLSSLRTHTHTHKRVHVQTHIVLIQRNLPCINRGKRETKKLFYRRSRY